MSHLFLDPPMVSLLTVKSQSLCWSHYLFSSSFNNPPLISVPATLFPCCSLTALGMHWPQRCSIYLLTLSAHTSPKELHGSSLISFRFLLKCYIFSEAFLHHPTIIANFSPAHMYLHMCMLSTPSLSLFFPLNTSQYMWHVLLMYLPYHLLLH